MSDDKPKSVSEYKKWLKECHDVEISTRTRTYYETVSSKVATDFEASQFWRGLSSCIDTIGQRYYLDTNYNLFLQSSLPDLVTKPFASFLEKTFRGNVVRNANWPGPPDCGWLLPGNWLSRINDIVRTCFVVKYLDGVSFFASELSRLCDDNGYRNRLDFEAKEEGYYAAHFYVSFPCEIPREDWDTKGEVISIEIQITTQLQEVIRRLLHKFYEERRVCRSAADAKWQWNYKSDEFAANYLGHILHYVEGMIMDVRDGKASKENTDEN